LIFRHCIDECRLLNAIIIDPGYPGKLGHVYVETQGVIYLWYQVGVSQRVFSANTVLLALYQPFNGIKSFSNPMVIPGRFFFFGNIEILGQIAEDAQIVQWMNVARYRINYLSDPCSCTVILRY
jgi:hypothetical protein